MGAYLWIGLGGALGSMGRHGSNYLYGRLFGVSHLWAGTVIINILGSLVIGLASSLMGSEGRFTASQTAQQFVMVGLCGGYTTFSSFSLYTLGLIQGSHWLEAGLNIVLSVALCLIAVWAGHTAGTLVSGG